MKPKNFHYEFIQNVWNKSHQQVMDQVDIEIKNRIYSSFSDKMTILLKNKKNLQKLSFSGVPKYD
jgi:hypothetical protein